MEEHKESKLAKCIGFLHDKAIKYTVRYTQLNYTCLKVLLVAEFYYNKQGHFTTKDLKTIIPSRASAGMTTKKLFELGYIEKLPGSEYFPLPNGGVQRLLTKYALTGKGLYLVRKYSEYVRKLIADLEG